MNIPEFIVSLTSSLAWPVATLVIVFLLRSDLAALLGRISSLKHKDTELQFREQLAQAAAELDRHPQHSHEFLSTPEAEKVLAILDIDPKSAVVAAWVEFEGAAREALPEDLKELVQKRPIPHVIDNLAKRGVLAESDAEFLRILRQLRNEALHNPAINLDSELAYKTVTPLLMLAWELKNKK